MSDIFEFPRYGIIIRVQDGAGAIESKLAEWFCGEAGGELVELTEVEQAQVDVIESLLLSLACEDVLHPIEKFQQALDSTMDKLVNEAS